MIKQIQVVTAQGIISTYKVGEKHDPSDEREIHSIEYSGGHYDERGFYFSGKYLVKDSGGRIISIVSENAPIIVD